jgi:hypothetical protein
MHTNTARMTRSGNPIVTGIGIRRYVIGIPITQTCITGTNTPTFVERAIADEPNRFWTRIARPDDAPPPAANGDHAITEMHGFGPMRLG